MKYKVLHKHANLQLRIFSAAILIPLVLLVIYSPKIIFCSSVILISALMMIEWQGIVKQHRANKIAWQVGGVLYVLIFGCSLLRLRFLNSGSDVLLWLVLTVWVADTAAFIFGRMFGGPKLALKISPAKTWSGFCGAVLSCAVVGVVLSICLGAEHGFLFIWTTILLGVISQVSDLLESWIKRKAGIKDSGSLIPGHGGILDRTDSFVLSAPTLVLMCMIFKDIFR